MSPLRLLWPAVAVGSVCTAACLFVSVLLQPALYRQLGSVAHELARLRASAGLQPGAFNDTFDGTTIYVGKKAGQEDEFRHVLFYDGRNPRSRTVVFANSGKAFSRKDLNLLFLELSQGSVHPIDRNEASYAYATFGSLEQNVDIGWQVSRSSKFMGRLGGLGTAALSQLAADGSLPEPARTEASLEFHRRYAFPFACLAMALVAAAMGCPARSGQRRWVWPWAVAAIVAYYLVDRLGEAAALNAVMTPAAGAWAANALLGAAAGVLLLRRA